MQVSRLQKDRIDWLCLSLVVDLQVANAKLDILHLLCFGYVGV